MDLSAVSVGTVGFVGRHGLWTAEQQDAAERVAAQIDGLRLVRVSWGDQHGLLRGRTLTPATFGRALGNGVDCCVAPLLFDSANGSPFNAFVAGAGLQMPELTGAPDVILVPDPLTFRVLPWAPDTGWALSDMYFRDGSPVPFATRNIMRRALDALAGRGLDYITGLEVEFYITQLDDPMLDPEKCGLPGCPPEPPVVRPIAHGYQLASEAHTDEKAPILQVLTDHLGELGLPLRSIDDEWGPGQCEFTFEPLCGLGSADAMLLFRSAVKQICRRHGYLATFMCKPALANFFASGWHLHQSLVVRATGDNAMVCHDGVEVLSPVGRHFLGGLLDHATAASVFTTPTINGYRRRVPFSLAPDRATWGYDNRAAMIRVQGAPGDSATHLENRVGEPAANPHLYMACQIYAGLDGIERALDPGPPNDEPYAAAERPLLPATLMEAVAALRTDPFFRARMGEAFIDYLVALKEHEIGRFLAAEPDWQTHPDQVTEWEHREYFEAY
jgi:glutamine synthetase